MAVKSGENEIFPFCIGQSCTTLRVKNSLEITLSLTVLRYSHFYIFHKDPRWLPEVAKMENFPLCIRHSCTTLWVKNSLEIALSLTVFEIFTLLHFPQRSKMAARSGKNGKFSPLHKTLLYYPVGQKFPRNRSISYGFRDIHTFSFSAKIQDGRQKWQKWKVFRYQRYTLVLPWGSKIPSKSLYLLWFSRYSHFFIFRKNPRWLPKVAKIEIFLLHRTLLYSPVDQKFARNRSISYGFEIFKLFHFPQKSKMAAKCGKNGNFSVA